MAKSSLGNCAAVVGQFLVIAKLREKRQPSGNKCCFDVSWKLHLKYCNMFSHELGIKAGGMVVVFFHRKVPKVH